MDNMVGWFRFDSTYYNWLRSIFVDRDLLGSTSIICDSPM
jgi:hypothetical protein